MNRPNRAARRLKGKSDPLDAYQAAQSVFDGRTTSVPKAKDGPVECLRILRAGRTSALKARTAAINQVKGLLVSAPDKLRAKYRGLGTSAMITALQRTRPSGHMADPEYVCLLTLKALATRCHSLAAEIASADAALHMFKGSSLSEEQREAAVALFATGWGSMAVASLGWVGKLSSGCTTVE